MQPQWQLAILQVLWLVIGIHWVLAHNAWHNPHSLTLPYQHKLFLSITTVIICYCCLVTIIITFIVAYHQNDNLFFWEKMSGSPGHNGSQRI